MIATMADIDGVFQLLESRSGPKSVPDADFCDFLRRRGSPILEAGLPAWPRS